ncbi:Uncharacterised protein [Segatella copri]|nr:Uncharacterised protein [Segatella copri]
MNPGIFSLPFESESWTQINITPRKSSIYRRVTITHILAKHTHIKARYQLPLTLFILPVYHRFMLPEQAVGMIAIGIIQIIQGTLT